MRWHIGCSGFHYKEWKGVFYPEKMAHCLLITHYKQFIECKDLLAYFYATVRSGLRDKLGPILFQVTPQRKYSEEKLRRILDSIDTLFTNVIEFSQAEWWRKEVKEELIKKRVSFCGISYPGLPNEPVVNNETAYYRFHGVTQLYHSPHTEADIREITDFFRRNEDIKQVFVFFNNTASLAAIKNARYLESQLFEKNSLTKKGPIYCRQSCTRWGR